MLQGSLQVSSKRGVWEAVQRHTLQGFDPVLYVGDDLFPFGVFPPDSGESSCRVLRKDFLLLRGLT
jgi:hypothetical protein